MFHSSRPPYRSTKMFKLSTAIALLASLVTFSSIPDVSARLAGSSDIRENIDKSVSITKAEGDECVMLEEDIFNKGSVDVDFLGCGEALTCREDETSATGARCVEFEEVDLKCIGNLKQGCTCTGEMNTGIRTCDDSGSDCCDGVCKNYGTAKNWCVSASFAAEY